MVFVTTPHTLRHPHTHTAKHSPVCEVAAECKEVLVQFLQRPFLKNIVDPLPFVEVAIQEVQGDQVCLIPSSCYGNKNMAAISYTGTEPRIRAHIVLFQLYR